MEILINDEDLQFKVSVPEGCVIVAALRLPSGQLVELKDLSAEDAAGVQVGEKLPGGGARTGPVKEERVEQARENEKLIREEEQLQRVPLGQKVGVAGPFKVTHTRTLADAYKVGRMITTEEVEET